MGRLSRGYSICVAVLAAIQLIFGLWLSVCAWIINSKFSDIRIYAYDSILLGLRLSFSKEYYYTKHWYWLGGIVVSRKPFIPN